MNRYDAPSRLPECPHSIATYGTLLWVCAINCSTIISTHDILRAPPISIDQVVSDFDGVTFHLSTPESKSKILISISVKCYKELLQYGAQQVLEREYGSYIVSPEAGYDFSLQVDLDNLPGEQGSRSLAWHTGRANKLFDRGT